MDLEDRGIQAFAKLPTDTAKLPYRKLLPIYTSNIASVFFSTNMDLVQKDNKIKWNIQSVGS